LDKAALGKTLRQVRREKGYSQNVLAEKAGIGNVYLGEIERGQKMPSLNSFIKIIEALDVSADYILRNELNSGQDYIYDEITQKLKGLTPKQRKTAVDLLEAYLRNLD
jgi:transcriptional regulator with XRE-family HTH domain